MQLQQLPFNFSVCKITSIEEINFMDDFTFFSKTDDELSLVCKSEVIPSNAITIENGWRALKIVGILDFGMVGIIAKIATILADNEISIFVVSTYNTDYVLLKKHQYNKAISLLQNYGYEIL